MSPQNSVIRPDCRSACSRLRQASVCLQGRRQGQSAWSRQRSRIGGIGTIGSRVTSDADMARAIEFGFSVKAIDALKKTGITDKEIGRLVIKPRTLSHRVQRRRRLTSDEFDRAARVARVAALAIKTFANKDKANAWLHKPLSSLDGRRPLDLIGTTAGARVIEDVLTRIAWGSAA